MPTAAPSVYLNSSSGYTLNIQIYTVSGETAESPPHPPHDTLTPIHLKYLRLWIHTWLGTKHTLSHNKYAHTYSHRWLLVILPAHLSPLNHNTFAQADPSAWICSLFSAWRNQIFIFISPVLTQCLFYVFPVCSHLVFTGATRGLCPSLHCCVMTPDRGLVFGHSEQSLAAWWVGLSNSPESLSHTVSAVFLPPSSLSSLEEKIPPIAISQDQLCRVLNVPEAWTPPWLSRSLVEAEHLCSFNVPQEFMHIYIYIYLCMDVLIIHLSIYPSIHPCIHLFFHPSMHLLIHHLSLHLLGRDDKQCPRKQTPFVLFIFIFFLKH